MQLREDAEAVCWFLRSIEANRNYPFAHFWPQMHSRYSARWIRRGPLQMQDLRSIQALPSAASVTADRVTIQPSSPDASAYLRACGLPECQRGEGCGSPVAYRPDDHKVITPLLQPNVADAFPSNLGVKGKAALTRNLR